MTEFGRAFQSQHFDRALAENAWLRDLLARWRPAGDAIDKNSAPDSLRLCVRDGYLNFYRAGQSIAAVSLLRDGRPRAEIHSKYVYGDRGQGQNYVTLSSQGYPHIDSGKLVPYEAACLDRWISNVNPSASGVADSHHGHTGPEKRFVDLVVGNNPNVIDLEMAVPAFKDRQGLRRAPRMDLVALEPHDDRWRVVFWEVKRVDDPRARSRGDVPHVCKKQLAPFAEWLEYSHTLVAAAYTRVCQILVTFHEHAKRLRPDIEDLGVGIRAVASVGAPRLLVDCSPRLLIDDLTAPDNGFAPHLEKLRSFYEVQIVQSPDHLALKARPCRES